MVPEDLRDKLTDHAMRLAERWIQITDGTTVNYLYDGDGVRVQKTLVGNPAQVTNYLFDRNLGLSQVLLEADGSNAAQAAYVRDAYGMLLAAACPQFLYRTYSPCPSAGS